MARRTTGRRFPVSRRGARLTVAATDPRMAAGLDRLRSEAGLPGEFSAAALAEAERATAPAPDHDDTALALVTVDPAGSMDLDQALHLAARGDGFRVSYAIADPAGFVPPGGAMDTEAWARGETVYLPDARVPLYPAALSESRASLLPGVDRPALLWTMDLDAVGEPVAVDLRRTLVRSQARLDYEQVQQRLDAGTAEAPYALLGTLGRLLQQRAADRGALDLRTPDQEIEQTEQGYRLVLRAGLEAEGWNAQLSLLTGRCAARMMLDGDVGLLRTLPPPDPSEVERLRRAAAALGVDWPAAMTPGAFVSALDPGTPAGAALMSLAPSLLRGAGYTPLPAPAGTTPEQLSHGAVAAPYAHATAPLRRLADRVVGRTCLALAAGEEVPQELVEQAARLPEVMTASGRRASVVERGAVDLVEALLLEPHVGERFAATVLRSDAKPARAKVQLKQPPVLTTVQADLPVGAEVELELVSCDVDTRTLELRPV